MEERGEILASRADSLAKSISCWVINRDGAGCPAFSRFDGRGVLCSSSISMSFRFDELCLLNNVMSLSLVHALTSSAQS